MEGQIPVPLRTLILLVTAARNSGTDPWTAVQAVVRPSPSREVVAAIEALLDSPEVAHEPGMPAAVVFARIALPAI
ncbi:hypothetical protein [Nocardia sp. NBC_01327]|uniref:hypothetical protein n=1 Tax=Nocardia sp. NBC_01327 TaxID=2903593 RepID=UPI002E0EEE28|nr:hypothetical protein OG326_23600 [Nocardia sp. NBC_01327]